MAIALSEAGAETLALSRTQDDLDTLKQEVASSLKSNVSLSVVKKIIDYYVYTCRVARPFNRRLCSSPPSFVE